MDQRMRDPGPLGDLAHSDVVWVPGRKELNGSVEDPFAGFLPTASDMRRTLRGGGAALRSTLG